MAQPPDLPNGFYAVSIQYEYFKRNPSDEALKGKQRAERRYQEIIRQFEASKDLGSPDKVKNQGERDPGEAEDRNKKNAEEDAPERVSPSNPKKRKCQLEDKKPPAKRQDPGQEDKETGDVSDRGSDPLPIEESDSQEASDPPIIQQDPNIVKGRVSEDLVVNLNQEPIHMGTINRMYNIFIENETHEMEHERWPLGAQDVLTILSIRKVFKEYIDGKVKKLEDKDEIDSIELPIHKLKVIVGYEKIRIQFCHNETNEWTTLQYMSHGNGCLQWYGDTVTELPTAKFYNRAAADFYFLTQHPDLKLEELDMDVEEYRRGDEKVYPNEEFYDKIDADSCHSPQGISVKKFSMKYFKERILSPDGPRILMKIFSHIASGVESIKIRVWNDEHILERTGIERMVGGRELIETLHKADRTDQWNDAKELDIYDEKIRIQYFDSISHFDLVRVIIRPEDFAQLGMTFPAIIIKVGHITNILVQPDFDINLIPNTFHTRHGHFLGSGMLIRFRNDFNQPRFIITRPTEEYNSEQLANLFNQYANFHNPQ